MTKKSSTFFYSYLFLCLATFVMTFSASVSYAREMSEYPRVKLQSLDKVTAHTVTFEAKVGDTLKFGPIYMKVQSCQKSSPIDEPESAAFIQIWEIDTDEESQWIFSGWMFASSPGLSPMDHPIYDVWVIDCLGDKEPVEGQTNEKSTDDGAHKGGSDETLITPPSIEPREIKSDQGDLLE